MPMLASAMSGWPGIAGGSAGFSRKPVIVRSASTAITPKALALSRGTAMQRDRALVPLRHVIGEHQCVVHLVDVVACKHDDEVGSVVRDDVLVLPDRVGRAAVPVLFVHALLRRQQIDELVHLALQEGPAALQVAQQTVRLVLRDDADAPNRRNSGSSTARSR